MDYWAAATLHTLHTTDRHNLSLLCYIAESQLQSIEQYTRFEDLRMRGQRFYYYFSRLSCDRAPRLQVFN